MGMAKLRFWPLALLLVPLITLLSLYLSLLASAAAGFRASRTTAPGVPARIQAARGPLATLIQMSDVHLIRVDGEDDDGGRSDDLTTTLLAVQALGTDSATETCLIGRKLTRFNSVWGFVQSSRR